MKITKRFLTRCRRFQFSWKLTLTVIIMLFIQFELGMWQIHRYEYRKTALQQFQADAMQAPVSLKSLVTEQNPNYQHIKATGHYINDEQMLIQNITQGDRVGFDVITPFEVAHTQKYLLINRGWVPALGMNKLPAAVEPVRGEQHITGYVYLLNQPNFKLGKNILTPQRWPLVMQKVQVTELERLTNKDFYPFVFRLDPKAPHGFVRQWQIVTVNPERDMSYAVQWFGMGVGLCFVYFFLSTGETEAEKDIA